MLVYRVLEAFVLFFHLPGVTFLVTKGLTRMLTSATTPTHYCQMDRPRFVVSVRTMATRLISKMTLFTRTWSCGPSKDTVIRIEMWRI